MHASCNNLGGGYNAGAASQYPHTQPEYTYPTHQAYQHPPGLLKMGFFHSKEMPGYSRRSGVNPSYYYEAAHQSYFGPWYRPAPTVIPPYYTPYKTPAASYNNHG